MSARCLSCDAQAVKRGDQYVIPHAYDCPEVGRWGQVADQELPQRTQERGRMNDHHDACDKVMYEGGSCTCDLLAEDDRRATEPQESDSSSIADR